jgi:predicted methyltransferase
MELDDWCNDLIVVLREWADKEVDAIISDGERFIKQGHLDGDVKILVQNEIYDRFSILLNKTGNLKAVIYRHKDDEEFCREWMARQ